MPHDNPARLSRILAGAWRMGQWQQSVEARLAWIEAAIDAGLTSFDHADLYGDYAVEGLFGEALERAPALRERMQIVSKCGIRLVGPARPAHRVKHYDTSAGHVRASVEHSLRALRTDRLDLLLIHRPDLLMAPQELARCFEDLRREGKVLQFGVSNHTPSQLALLHEWIPLAAHQVECSPLHLDALHDGTLDQCQSLGLTPMIWSPLAGGRLFTGQGEAARRVREALGRIGERLGVAPATVAYAWLLRHPSRPHPITGSGRIEALREAAAALDLEMDRETWYELWSAGAGREVA